MSVSIIRCVLCWVMVAILPSSLLASPGRGQPAFGQAEPRQTGPGQGVSAILHTQGGVWVNGFEAADATAIFAGDELETRPGFSANLSVAGSSVLMQAESVGKFQGDLLELDHGSVSVGTSTIFKVRVKCITVVPVSTDWTQYDVADLNGTVKVSAHKNDVRVEVGAGRAKPTEPGASNDASVHEGEQRSYGESDLCGAPARPTEASSRLDPKWIGAGAGGAGLLIWILVHGGGSKTPVSGMQP